MLIFSSGGGLVAFAFFIKALLFGAVFSVSAFSQTDTASVTFVVNLNPHTLESGNIPKQTITLYMAAAPL